MTSRTTPVGIIVIALVSLIAVGCSAPTSAVFQALFDPAGATTPATEADPAVDPAETGGDDPSWWPHPDGYRMVLPTGWSGVVVDQDRAALIIAAVDEEMPDLAARIDAVLDDGKTRVSGVAMDPSAVGNVAPVLVVLAQPTEGKRAHAVKTQVREQINGLPGLTGLIAPHDVVLPTAKGVRFDYTIDDPDLGELRVRSYLFRYGKQAYLVNFIASEDVADEAEEIFDAIADSLRFGV